MIRDQIRYFKRWRFSIASFILTYIWITLIVKNLCLPTDPSPAIESRDDADEKPPPLFAPSSSTVWTGRNTSSTHQLQLCPDDFQKSLELTAFNRTLIVYEVEWRSNRQFDILLMVVENVQFPLAFIGDLAPHFDQMYTIGCLHGSSRSRGRFRHVNTHEYDRTVVVECPDLDLDENINSTFKLQFIELATTAIISIDIRLCSALIRPVTVGLCQKAFFGNISFYLIEQWLNYHIYIGVQRFYLYDRTARYEAQLKPYIDRGYVVYVRYPLPKQIEHRKRFNWIDQFVGKMHCLMQTRSSVEWLGTWDFDEYIHFFPNPSQPVFLPYCQSNGNCRSMLGDYLRQNLANYSNVILYAVNFIGDGNVSAAAARTNETIIIEEYQGRSVVWNDRMKYIVQPKSVRFMNIHYAVVLPGTGSYQSFVSTPDEFKMADPRSWIRINHYPSALIVRDRIFLKLQSGPNRTAHDSSIWNVFRQLKAIDIDQKASQEENMLV